MRTEHRHVWVMMRCDVGLRECLRERGLNLGRRKKQTRVASCFFLGAAKASATEWRIRSVDEALPCERHHEEVVAHIQESV